MANVPEYQRRVQSRAVNQQSINVQTSANTFGAGVGGAVQQASDGVFKAAEALDFETQLTEDAQSREAFDRLRKNQQHYLNNPENGVLNRTGGNGMAVDKSYDEDFAKLREEAAVGLSPAALKKYNERARDLGIQGGTRVMSHASTQKRDYITNQRAATVNGYAEEAASNWDNPELFEQNLGQALAEQSELGALQGWDAATQQAAAETLISGTTRARIVQMAVNDPLGAEELLNNSRDILQSDDTHALDTGLKSLVRDAKVNAFVQPYVKAGLGAASDPYETAMHTAESGGNPNAANNKANPGFASKDGRYSSALGLRQYLRGTYRDAVRDLQRAGGAKWAEGMSDDELMRTRTNPKLEGEVHAHVRKQNQGKLAVNGFEVNPTNEYIMHHFGAAGGPAMLHGLRDNPNAPASVILNAATLKSNPQFKGKTVAQAYDWVSNHLGADTKTASGGKFFDATAAMAAAAAIEDPEVQAAALAKISSLMTMQDRARTASQGEAQRTAWEGYLQTGSSDVPLELKSAMGQGGWASFQASVRNDEIGVDVTNEDTWQTLTELAGEDPQAFTELEMEGYRPSLSRADMKQFIEMQQATKAKMTGDALAEKDARNSMNYGKMFTDAAPVYEAMVYDGQTPSAGKLNDEQKKQKVEFERNLMRMANDFFDKEKRAPTTEETRAMASVLSMPVRYTAPDPAFLWREAGTREVGTGHFFDVENRPVGSDFELTVEYDDIPTSERANVARQIMAANGGLLPTPEEVAEVYEQQQLMSVGLPPQVSLDSVPESFVKSAQTRRRGITDDEVVEAYQLYLMSQ